MPESTVQLGVEQPPPPNNDSPHNNNEPHEPHSNSTLHLPAKPPEESLSGTKLHRAIGAGAGEAVAAVMGGGVMGLTAGAARIANIAGIALLTAIGIGGLWQLRNDGQADRADYRGQLLRSEQQNEERRREDRSDRQRTEDLFRTTLEAMARDNRESVTQMKIVSEQVKASSEQMRAATEAMLRVEKMLTTKMPPGH